MHSKYAAQDLEQRLFDQVAYMHQHVLSQKRFEEFHFTELFRWLLLFSCSQIGNLSRVAMLKSLKTSWNWLSFNC